MNENFQKVEMYKCCWCGKLFKTTTRHKCMFRPDKRNCFSCKHCVGFENFKGQYDEYGRCELPPYQIFTCDLEEVVDSEYPELEKLRERNWEGNCPYYETRKGYKGKKSYAELFY